jgi:hypothetical protein
MPEKMRSIPEVVNHDFPVQVIVSKEGLMLSPFGLPSVHVNDVNAFSTGQNGKPPGLKRFRAIVIG